MKHKKVLSLPLAFLALLITQISALSVVAQEITPDEEKSIKAEEFIVNRPSARPQDRKPPAVRYKPTVRTTPLVTSTTLPRGMVFAQIGVTIWRFRPATTNDKTKELVEEEGDTPAGEYALERIEEGTLLSPGQILRLGIESLSRDGYVYVIAREQYADGSTSDPKLLFPSKTNVNNQVKAGRLVYIPGPPRRFRIRPSQSNKNHVAELLTIVVASKPLVDTAQVVPTAISRAQFDSWEKQWSAPTVKFEMEGGAGSTMTEKEQAAGSVTSSDLTQDDPVPQTVFRMMTKPESTLLINVPLRFVKAKS